MPLLLPAPVPGEPAPVPGVPDEPPFEPSTGAAEDGEAGDGEGEPTWAAAEETDEPLGASPATTGIEAIGDAAADEAGATELTTAGLPAAELVEEAEAAGLLAAELAGEAEPPTATEGAGPPTAADELEALAEAADDADDARGFETAALDELATVTDEALLALAEVVAGLTEVGIGVTGLTVVVVAALVLVTGAAEVQGLLQPLVYLEVVLGPLPTVLAPN